MLEKSHDALLSTPLSCVPGIRILGLAWSGAINRNLAWLLACLLSTFLFICQRIHGCHMEKHTADRIRIRKVAISQDDAWHINFVLDHEEAKNVEGPNVILFIFSR